MAAEPTASATAATAADVVPILREQRRAWDSRPLLRRIYGAWFEQIAARLSPAGGPTVELGCGCGTFKDYLPEAVATDLVETPWTDLVADAQSLPFAAGEVANLVMVDVLHHVARPDLALREAQRVLAPGGRLVLAEPYCSPLSGFGYRRFHHEPLDLRADLEAVAAQSGDDPFDANIALPTLIFWRRQQLLGVWAPGLRVAERRRSAWLAYPLSGGFTGTRLLPLAAASPALALDAALAPALAPLGAYRCLVVVERLS